MKKAWVMVMSLVLVVILLGIVSSFVFSPSSETSKSSSIIRSQPYDNTSYAEILHFLERLMTFPGAPCPKPIAILPGKLPSDLPVKIPVPNDAEVIGSLVRSDGNYKQVHTILDVPRQPNEILEFYRNSLKKAGWNEQEIFYDNFGFSSTPLIPESVIFCRYENEGPSLTVSAYTSSSREKLADVRLDLNTNPQAVCSERYERESTMDVLPLLLAPKGAVAKGSGGQSSSGYMRNLYITLETELNVTELETHYRNQLVEADWNLNDKGNNGPIAWSNWSFTDEFGGNWSGLLLVSRPGKGNLRFIELMVS